MAVDNRERTINADEGLVVGTVPQLFAMGQQLSLAKKLQSAEIAVVIDPFPVQLEMPI